MIPIASLPTVNAILNSLSALFLIAGFIMIRKKRIRAHRGFMIAAFSTSVVFLISYLTYHYHAGTTRFPDIGVVRAIYLIILLTHTVLAAIVPFLAVLSLFRALSNQWDKHRKIARWTLPVWLYVSVTGVVIYLMLYHLYR